MADEVPNSARIALRARLDQAAPYILDDPTYDPAAFGTMQLLLTLAGIVRRDADRARYWLLMTVVSGVMPTKEQLLRGYRMLELSEPGTEHYAVLHGCAGMASGNENFERSLTVVNDRTIVEVDFSARHGHNTGIQRVVRETISRWNVKHDPLLVAWTEDGQQMRSLVPEEETRVVAWTSSRKLESSPASWDLAAETIVPWNAVILLPEVAQHRVWERLACLAEFSSNRVALIGYDAIPVSSAEYVIPSESDRFVRYLSVVKNADLVLGISESSSEEFAGFADSLKAQDLRGPRVKTVRLPVALPATEAAGAGVRDRESELPLVLCVGTQEPRKNQLGVLAASEILWQRGLEFELLFIGSAAMPLSVPFDIEVERLHRAGRKITVIRHASDFELERAYRAARFSIFVSLHEGYGLPVGESLAAGTPVVTTNFGSTAEIAAGGGCLLVDPRDDFAIAEAMASLLTDEELLQTLRTEARARPNRTWDDYATELWEAVAELGMTR